MLDAKGAASHVLARPPETRAGVLTALLNEAKSWGIGTAEHAATLERNAHLVTALRETCEARNIATPWYTGPRRGSRR